MIPAGPATVAGTVRWCLDAVRDWPLRRKVSALLVITSALPLMLVTAIVLERERGMVRDANVSLLRARVDQIGDTLTALLRGFRSAASGAAKDPSIVAYCLGDLEARRRSATEIARHLEILRERDPAIRGLGLVDGAGQVQAATEEALVGQSIAYRDYYQRARRGEATVSDVYVSIDASKNVATVAIAEPVRDGAGEVRGVLVLWLRAQALWDVMRAANGTAGPGSYFILFDRHGIRIGHSLAEGLLFHPSEPLAPAARQALVAEHRFRERTGELLSAVVPYPYTEVRGSSGSVYRRARSANQADNLAVARPLADPPWTLVAHVPEASVEVGVGSVLHRVLPGFAMGTLLAALGAFALLRRVVNPVTRLAAAAAALERGDLDHQLDPAPPAAREGGDEVARLTEAFRAMARSLAERERAGQASNRELRLVLDNMGQGFLAMDAAGQIGRERSAVIDAWLGAPGAGEPIWDYLGRHDLAFSAAMRGAWAAAVTGAAGPRPDLSQLPRSLQREGRTFHLRFRVVETGGRLDRVLLVVADVTDEQARRRHELALEAELRQAQKLESVGRLAAGIAHEINTPLQFVSDSCCFLEDAVGDVRTLIATYREHLSAGPADGPVGDARATVAAAEEAADVDYLMEQMPKAMARARDGLQRVTTIVRAMKEFAHPDQKEMTAVDLNRAVTSTLTIARNEYKYVAEVATDLGPLPPVICHPGEVNQALLNIIVNAAHAIAHTVRGIDRKGLITVRTRVEGDRAVVAISDTGGGIPEAIRDRIYDPFFTTKEVGQGTGQGLWLSRSVVCDKHGGELDFETEVGQGTTFYIRLPIEGRRPAGAPAGAGSAA